ncbi:MAG: glycosyltransferase [Gemmatimonadales bacterium]
MTEPVRISVVIPTYQRCASVRRTLEALARQTMATTEYEVVVSIDGSVDGTKEMAEGFPAPYRLSAIWQPNRGRAAARNAGIRIATGDLVVFLDDDMEPVPAFLVAHHDAHPLGSRRAVVGPVPIPDDPSLPPIVHYRRCGTNALLDRLAQPGYRLAFRDVYTGNLSLPRNVLREVGGFDETFRLYGHEDYELALRLEKAGVELVFSPQAVAYQRYDKDFAGLARDCVARGHTAVLFAEKHPDVGSSLKLGTYGEGSRKSRFLLSLLLWLSGWLPRFPEWLIGSMKWIERRQPRRLHDYYTLALDYFFWMGARSALRKPPGPDFRRASSPVYAPDQDAGGTNRGRRAAWMRIGLYLLVLFAIVSSVRLLGRTLRVADLSGPDEITRYEARFQELRHVLPPRARVGYLTDHMPQSAAAGDDAPRLAFKRYLLTQYALLPAMVLPGIHGQLTVGNFHSADGMDSTATRGLTLIRDFGNGVLLFRTSAE